MGCANDVLIAISTSGNSTNIINAINTAVRKELKVIILTGETGGKMSKLGDVKIAIPSQNTQRIQEGHLLVEHMLCETLEEWFLTLDHS
jgi:D-sedoheptulose 7-phosphate isomerase